MDRQQAAPLAAILGAAGLIFVGGCLVLVAGCSKEDGTPSFVSEAQATAVPDGPDYGWKSRVSPPDGGAADDGTVYDYY